MTSSVKLEPLGARLLVRYRPLPETTGLIVRIQHQEYTRWADVIAVGQECVDTRQGMVVKLPALAGQQTDGYATIEVGTEVIVSESAVLAYDIDGEEVPARGRVRVRSVETEETMPG